MSAGPRADGRHVRILIMGCGAVGAYFGAMLARAGESVVFVARGANGAALRARGVRVESAGGAWTVAPVRVVETPPEAGPCDVVLVCVKSYDAASAAAALRPVVHAGTIVLSLQNGVENEALLAALLGVPPLLGGLTHIGAELVAPGVVRHDEGGRIIFGEFDGRASERGRTLARCFEAAGIDYRLSGHIAVMLWDKLAWNAAFNAITAVTRRTVGEVLEHPDGEALVRTAMAEVAAAARAAGVPLDPARIDAAIAYSRMELGHLRTSMLQDLERGRRLEHEALNGAVIRAAERGGVAVPVNRALYAILAGLDAQREARRASGAASGPLSRITRGRGRG